MFYGMWLFLFEAAWLIYGNTFIYDDKIEHCDETFESKWKHSHLNTNTLKNTVLVLIIYGYFLFFVILLVILLYVGLFFGYRAYVKQDLASKEAIEQLDETNKTKQAGLTL